MQYGVKLFAKLAFIKICEVEKIPKQVEFSTIQSLFIKRKKLRMFLFFSYFSCYLCLY